MNFVVFTSDILDILLEASKDNIGIILPVAIGLFSLMLGIEYIPTVIKRFRFNGIDWSTKSDEEWRDYMDKNS